MPTTWKAENPHEDAHHRWADDGGFIPDTHDASVAVVRRSPWPMVGAAAAVGFVIGWLTSRR